MGTKLFLKNSSGQFLKNSSGQFLYKALPSTYQEVEYIQSSGTQYVDLGIAGNKDIGVEIKARSLSSTGALFGSRTDPTTANIELVFDNNNFYLDFGNYSQTRLLYSISYDSLGDFIAYNSATVRYIKNQKATTQYTGADFTTPTNLMLGSAPGSFVSEKWNGRIYYCKLWTGTALIRSLVPCYRKSDNVIGLYDLVNGVFYTNSGSGSFTKGPNV